MIHRNAIEDFAGTRSSLISETLSELPPRVSIIIPTFRRPALLERAIASAFAQTYDGPYEVVVVDNDPTSEPHVAGWAGFTDNPDRAFRYFVNAENVGMFGNWNRGLSLARGEWVTILCDDDELDPEFLRRMTGYLSEHPECGGLFCQKRILDSRTEQVLDGLKSYRRVGLVHGILDIIRFRGADSRPITARNFFWTDTVGNIVGFLFRRETALEIGGFYAEDFPSADYYFHVRYALKTGLRQLRQVLASVRFEENESLKAETCEGFMIKDAAMRAELLESAVPSYWRIYSRFITSRQYKVAARHFSSRIDIAKVEKATGLHIDMDPLDVALVARLVNGGL